MFAIVFKISKFKILEHNAKSSAHFYNDESNHKSFARRLIKAEFLFFMNFERFSDMMWPERKKTCYKNAKQRNVSSTVTRRKSFFEVL